MSAWLSPPPSEAGIARIARKLGTGDRAHMVALGMREGTIA